MLPFGTAAAEETPVPVALRPIHRFPRRRVVDDDPSCATRHRGHVAWQALGTPVLDREEVGVETSGPTRLPDDRPGQVGSQPVRTAHAKCPTRTDVRW
jgi:hypothetical protein